MGHDFVLLLILSCTNFSSIVIMIKDIMVRMWNSNQYVGRIIKWRRTKINKYSDTFLPLATLVRCDMPSLGWFTYGANDVQMRATICRNEELPYSSASWFVYWLAVLRTWKCVFCRDIVGIGNILIILGQREYIYVTF